MLVLTSTFKEKLRMMSPYCWWNVLRVLLPVERTLRPHRRRSALRRL